MNIKIALESVLLNAQNNKFERPRKCHEVCEEVDSAATKELMKDENYKDCVAGR